MLCEQGDLLSCSVMSASQLAWSYSVCIIGACRVMWSDSVLSMVVFESAVCNDNYTDLCVVLRCVFFFVDCCFCVQ